MDDNNMSQGYPDGFNPQAGDGFAQPGEYVNPNTNSYEQPDGYIDTNTGSYTELNGFGDPVPYQMQAPKKKKGGKIVLITAICILVAAVVVVGGLFVYKKFIKKTPEEIVKLAVKETFTDTEQQSVLEKATGISEFNEDKMDVDATLMIGSIYNMSGMTGAELSVEGAFEKQDDGSYNMSLTNCATIGGEALTAKLTCLDKVIYCELPELYSDVFKMDLASMMASVDISDSDAETQNGVRELYEKYMTPATEELKKSISYEEVGSAKIENHDGDSVKCKQYTVTLSSEAGRDYVDALADYLNAYVSDYVTDEQLENSGYTRAQMIQVFEYLPTYYGMIFSKDMAVNLYLKDDKIVRADMDYRFIVADTDVSVTLDLMGKDDPASNLYLEASVVSADKEVGSLTYSNVTDASGDKTVREIEGNVTANGTEAAKLTRTDTFDTSTNAFSSQMSVTADDETGFAYELSGSLKEIQKGKSFGATIDTCKVTDGASAVYAEFGGEVYVGDLGKEITAPDASKSVVDYTDMTDDYMQENIDQEALTRISEAWKQAVGSEESAADYIDELVSDETEIDVSEDGEEEIVVDRSDLEDVDYTGIVMKGDSHTVAIIDPSGYDRSFADEAEIDIYNDKWNAYYTLSENCDKDAECSGFTDYFTYMGDSASVVDQGMEQVTNSDGLEMDCYVINAEIYGVKTRDYYFFYPLNDTDYVIVDVNVWASEEGEEVDADITDVANELVNSAVISEQ